MGVRLPLTTPIQNHQFQLPQYLPTPIQNHQFQLPQIQLLQIEFNQIEFNQIELHQIEETVQTNQPNGCCTIC